MSRFRAYIATYFYPLQVDWIHNGALKEFHSGKVSLEQAFELQVGRFPVINAQLTPRAGNGTSPSPVGALMHKLSLPAVRSSERVLRRTAVWSNDCVKIITR